MCTVTVVRSPGAVRVICNRDEQRTRAIALPPAPRPAGAATAIYPVDPVSGGTWVGVRDAAFAAVLLNRTRRGDSRTSVVVSRGTIVPLLLGANSFDKAVDTALALDVRRYMPFMLVIVDRLRAATIGGESAAGATFADPAAPLLRTSSALGDDVVERPRRALFEALVWRADNRLDGQQAFHRHAWPGRRDISVVMARADAATVSRTTIELDGSGASVSYEALRC